MLERNLKKPSLETIFAIAAAFEIKLPNSLKKLKNIMRKIRQKG
jgi:DNA-binding XRE family transcriptional regulator